MSFVLTKFFPLFVYPLGMVTGLLLVAFFLLLSKRKRSAGFLLFISLVLLWVSSTQVVAERVLHSLERLYPPSSIEKIPKADAIVVLGGVTRGRVPGNGLTDLGDGVDRIIHAARLFKAEKAISRDS
ncbi:MAG: YdcF family protein, partial [Candidatus Electrothrix sp. AUS4]|nr:YdcF family protein [Candidatus Electrothrix sp. AUS4]